MFVSHSLLTVTVLCPTGPSFEVTFHLTITPTPSHFILLSGNNQSAVISSAFSNDLSVTVTDSLDNPVPNINLVFSIIGSATFNGQASATVSTDSSGIATSPQLTAGTRAGTFNV